jgi:hypothetical protein
MTSWRALRLEPVWARVPVSSAGAGFELRADGGAGGGHARVADSARVVVERSGAAVGAVSAPPGAVVYAKARARGVSLLIGERAPGGRGASTITYVRHTGVGANGVAVCVLAGLVTPQRSRLQQLWAYAQPKASSTCAQLGVGAASALAGAAIDAHATGAVPPYDEPVTALPTVPLDAFQAMASIDKELAGAGV